MQKSNQNKLLLCYIVIFLVGICFVSVNNISAQDTLLPETTESCDCSSNPTDPGCKKYCGNYQLNDFVRIVVKVSQIILGLTGSLALLAFIYGGVMFLISAGNKERVEQAKKIIIGAVIGLIIVFASFIIINFIMTGLGYSLGDWYQVQ